MAQRPFNSIEGYSVGHDPQIAVIANDGGITATSLTVSGVSNLGPVGNLIVTGGTSGQVLSTDGLGNLAFVDSGSNSAAPMPYQINTGDSFIVPENFQGLFAYPITIDGTLEVDGVLIEVGLSTDASPSQIYFDVNGIPTGNAGFTFDSASGNLSLPGNVLVSGNILPSANITYSLGSENNRWNNLYLSGNTIVLGDSFITSDGSNLILINGEGGELVVSGNTSTSSSEIANNTSNISVNTDSITFAVNNVPNVAVLTSTKLEVVAIQTDNYYYANGQPFDPAGNPAGSNNAIQYNGNGEFAGSNNFTFNPDTSVLSLNGNLTVNNVANANVISANYLVSSLGCVTLGSGIIAVSGTSAGIFSSTVTNINLGLAANITMGSTTGNVTARGNFTANNITTSGTVTAEYVRVSDVYSKRPSVAVSSNTVVDTFGVTEYRSAKYTIKASNDLGYQALEVLLVHDDINSIITVYGSLSTTGNDIVTLSTAIVSGNVELRATGLVGNTTVNLMGTYVPD